MQILINSDKNVDADEDLERRVTEEVAAALSRFSDRLTRVEVHFGDENADKPGESDMRCMMEARPTGQRPIVVTHHAATLDQACSGAVQKMKSLLASKFSRMEALRGRGSIRHPHPS